MTDPVSSALRALHDCKVIRAHRTATGYETLVRLELAYAKPRPEHPGHADFRLTGKGIKIAHERFSTKGQ